MIATDNVRHPRGQTADDYLRRLLSELRGNTVQPGMASVDCRRVIGGKTYSSKTAACLATATASRDTEDSKWYLETLFRTQTGTFFLVGEGMESTPWRHWCQSRSDACRGHGILPLTESQVRLWLELRRLVTEYEEIFGLPEDASENP
jgi:hypothetical protein